MAQAAAAGKFTIPIARTFPLEQWREAMEISTSGKASGKLLLLPAASWTQGALRTSCYIAQSEILPPGRPHAGLHLKSSTSAASANKAATWLGSRRAFIDPLVEA